MKSEEVIKAGLNVTGFQLVNTTNSIYKNLLDDRKLTAGLSDDITVGLK